MHALQMSVKIKGKVEKCLSKVCGLLFKFKEVVNIQDVFSKHLQRALTQHTKPQAHISICCKFEKDRNWLLLQKPIRNRKSMNQQKYRKNSDDLST
jgi:hypothetical protein